MTATAQSSVSAARRALEVRTDAALANPQHLIGLMIDGALERIEAARECLKLGEVRRQHALLEAALLIVADLRASLDLRSGDSIAANFVDLYDYICRQLTAATLQNRIATLDEVSHLLRAIRSAWAVMPLEASITRVS